MTKNTHFDYIIIGNGLAGLQLALKMNSDTFFSDKRIGLIDASKKNENDKTWSFWEKGPSKWDNICYKSWQKASVITSRNKINLQLSPYAYKTIKSLDFYNHAKQALDKNDNFNFIIEHVNIVDDNTLVSITTNKNKYTANHVFDSRIPKTFKKESLNNISIIQHFKGWVIKTDANSFDEKTITMMDYRLKDGSQTSFTYVLPYSETEALVEFTYFTSAVVNEAVYDDYLKNYIKTFLKIERYTILETEKGQIPMTSFTFEKFNTKNVTKIGTGGGWVKASTGYSFKNTEKKITRIIKNIKAHKLPSQNLFKTRFKFYDKVFLKVLKDENEKGEWIFEQFYNKNSIQTMFRFLDEESTIFEELKIMGSLFSWSFIKAFFKTL